MSIRTVSWHPSPPPVIIGRGVSGPKTSIRTVSWHPSPPPVIIGRGVSGPKNLDQVSDLQVLMWRWWP